MVIHRVSARWASRISQPSFKPTQGSIYRRSWQKIQRRGYASSGEGGGHSTHKSSSDLPWAITSVVITVPSLWYLIQPQLQPKKGHGHGHGSEEHEEGHVQGGEHGEKTESGEDDGSSQGEDDRTGDQGHGEENPDEGNSNEAGDNEGGAKSERSSEAGPATPDDKGPTPEAYERDSGENVEGVQFKGATSGGTNEGEQGDTRKHIPDAKGGSKVRIESHYGNRQGVASEPEQDPDDKDMAAASKATGGAGSATTQSSKQEGLSNSDTKHSTDIQNDPGKSKKGEGTPETAKSKGTVDPFRKQV